jgi:uncharacterized protein (TIGR02001 family)
MKKAILSTAVISALFAGTALAELNVDANVAMTSDYRFRGISMSDEDASLMGGLGVSHSSGLYVSASAMSMDPDLHLNYVAGWKLDVSNFGLDLGYRRHDFTADELDADFDEMFASASMGSATVGVVWSDDYMGSDNEMTRLHAGWGMPVGPVNLSVEAGHNMFDDAAFDTGEDTYTDYKLAASMPLVDNVSVELAWIGTDLDKEDLGGMEWADDAVVLTVSASL